MKTLNLTNFQHSAVAPIKKTAIFESDPIDVEKIEETAENEPLQISKI
jgi:hypothetical protein